MGIHNLSISVILIVINVIVFFVVQNNAAKMQRMLFVNERVRRFKEYDRLFLSGFIHAGILHLGFNCMTLYFFGPTLEIMIGRTLFLILYLASIIGGNLYCMLMRKEDAGYSALGASGGVLGVIFGFVLLEPFATLSLMILPIRIPAWLFGIIFTLSSILLTQLKLGGEARISHEGHLGGALIGGIIVLSAGLVDFSVPENLFFIAGGLLPIVLFGSIKAIAPNLLYKHNR